MRELIFLTPWVLSEADPYARGISFLSKRFKVTVADLSPLLSPRTSLSPDVPPDTVRITSYDQLDSFLIRKREAFFCDYVLGLSPMLLKEARLFRLLARRNIRYFVVSASELPAASAAKEKIFAKALSRLRSSAGFMGYASDLAAKRVLSTLRAGGVYARPFRIYSVNRDSAERFASACGIGSGTVLQINSLDYTVFLEEKAKGLRLSDAGTCVLIDEGLVESRDFSYAGLRPLSADGYYPLVNSFLGRIAKELGLTVVVAAHPKSNPSELAARYPGIDIIRGRTLEAIASASLVLAHWSTAISFAVICAKPLLLLKSEEMEVKGLARFVDNMAAALGVGSVRMEDYLARPLGIVPASLPMTRYPEYMARYIHAESAGERGAWESVCEDLLALSGSGEHGS